MPSISSQEDAQKVDSRASRRLIDGLRRRHERRRRLFPRALLVGIVAGLIAALFRAALEAAEMGRSLVLYRLHPMGFPGLLLFAAICGTGVGLSVWLVQRFEPSASGSGIPQLKAVLHRLRAMAGIRLILVKFAGGVAAIGSGLALGREGPTIQMGGAVGRVVARWYPSSTHERGILIAAGSGAGLAAAFNAPLAGLVFVLEEIQKNFAPGVFSATFLACVTADAISRSLFSQSAILQTSPIAAPALASLPLFLVLGLAAGLLAVGFNRGLLRVVNAIGRASARGRLAMAVGVGLAIGAVAWFAPTLAGGGTPLVESALSGRGLIEGLIITLALRFVLTLASYGTGAPGGIFAPLLVLGSQGGLAAGLAVAAVWPSLGAEPRAWAVAGMAGLFAGTVRAPLTGIVLMLEMTESYTLMLPLLITSFAAQWVAERSGDPPIYDSLLERELLRAGPAETSEGAVMLELDVHSGAPFAGQRIGEIGLPQGCLIVTIDRRGRHLVATGDSVLRPGDRLQVLLAPEAIPAIGRLRSGLGVDGAHSPAVSSES
ncbi:MAG: H(+)/Cl(-) exchange transporter ClcA [Thermoanaerobaculia bacterium]